MGKHSVRFRCYHCGHCCTDVVCLPTPWDVARIVRETGLVPREFLDFLTPEGISGVPRSDPSWLRCNGSRYLMALRRDPSAGCCFLDPETKRCTIYASRPLLCGLYPFKLQETRSGDFRGFSLHRTGIECPRQRDDIVSAWPLHELYLEDAQHQEDYHALVEVFNRRKHSDKCPQDFVALFVEEVGAVSA